jgi:hypothetical protein
MLLFCFYWGGFDEGNAKGNRFLGKRLRRRAARTETWEVYIPCWFFSLVWSGETGAHTQNNTARAVVSGLIVGARVRRHHQIYVHADHRAGISW